ncbi:MAG: Uxx-star family glutaredoxin-like (seleno)protein [Patescibacteria group bacterium]|nr:Uxx-star family glutaredoxin-like (seleno)protein [Patescibacteria group bacterium]
MSKIIIYTTPTCAYCAKAKEFFKENKVAYSEIDVAADPMKAQKMIKKSGQIGVPVFDVGGKIIVGFDRGAISEALGIK